MAQIKLQPLESLPILDEVPETVTEGSNNMSGGADIAFEEETVPEFIFDFVVESDDEEDIETVTQMDGEIASEGDLESFIRTLQEAQNAAQEEERQKNASKKRPRFYTGNSVRSQQRHAANRRQLEAEGKTTFITQFFQGSRVKTMQDANLPQEPISEEPEIEVGTGYTTYFIFW